MYEWQLKKQYVKKSVQKSVKYLIQKKPSILIWEYKLPTIFLHVPQEPFVPLYVQLKS